MRGSNYTLNKKKTINAETNVYGDNVVFADFGQKSASYAPMQMAA